MQKIDTQADWIARAQQVLPAGGFGNFDPGIVIREGKGARVWDEDGNEYVDYLIGSGPMLLGHGHPEVHGGGVRATAQRHDLLCQQRRRDRTGRGDLSTPSPCAEQVRYVVLGRRGGHVRHPRWPAPLPGATRSSSSRAAITA